jgi:hypothetical protein
MKTLLVLLVTLGFAGMVSADTPTEMSIGEQVTPPELQYEFYCQPPHVYLWTVNACTGFGSVIYDDIPDEFFCINIVDVVFYVSQWGALWQDPAGVYVTFHYSECPPGLTPDVTYYFPWAELELELIYDDPGYFTSYRCTGYLSEPIHIEEDMSIGFQVHNTWGAAAPYSGVVMTDYNVTFGDCEAYWDGTYWGYVGYISGYFTDSGDVAYCLSDGTGGDPRIQLSGCYEDGPDTTIYIWTATAGASPVNDIELCVYDQFGNPVDITSCSVPGSWWCHFDPGSNCIYYYTENNPIPPGGTLYPFDFWMTPCYSTVMLIWTFTYNGMVVAGPETTYFDCGISATEPTSWGAIKSLYK